MALKDRKEKKSQQKNWYYRLIHHQSCMNVLKVFQGFECIMCKMQIGQAGGCAPLVSMLTSATALHSSVISFQMAVDHDEAQAHAATALAHLAALSSNQV